MANKILLIDNIEKFGKNTKGKIKKPSRHSLVDVTIKVPNNLVKGKKFEPKQDEILVEEDHNGVTTDSEFIYIDFVIGVNSSGFTVTVGYSSYYFSSILNMAEQLTMKLFSEFMIRLNPKQVNQLKRALDYIRELSATLIDMMSVNRHKIDTVMANRKW